MSAALMITASGMFSKTAPSTSIVRQGLSPQTEQRLLSRFLVHSVSRRDRILQFFHWTSGHAFHQLSLLRLFSIRLPVVDQDQDRSGHRR